MNSHPKEQYIKAEQQYCLWITNSVKNMHSNYAYTYFLLKIDSSTFLNRNIVKLAAHK